MSVIEKIDKYLVNEGTVSRDTAQQVYNWFENKPIPRVAYELDPDKSEFVKRVGIKRIGVSPSTRRLYVEDILTMAIGYPVDIDGGDLYDHNNGEVLIQGVAGKTLKDVIVTAKKKLGLKKRDGINL